MTEFDAIEYLKDILPHNKLYNEHEFSFTTAPSLTSMADMVYESRDEANHFVLVDTSTTSTSMGQSGGYFDNKQYTCFLLMRFEPGDEEDRIEKRNICRELRRQIHSKMLLDAEEYAEQELQYFDVSNILSQELSDFMLNGLTGIWFVLPVVSSADLRYKSNEWE